MQAAPARTSTAQSQGANPAPKKPKNLSPEEEEFEGTLAQATAPNELIRSAGAPQLGETPQGASQREAQKAAMPAEPSAFAKLASERVELGTESKSLFKQLPAGAMAADTTATARATAAEPSRLSLKEPELKPKQSLGAMSNSFAAGKPWSRDWVFVGNEEGDPDLKTLVKDQPKLGEGSIEPIDLRQVLEQLAKAEQGAAKTGAPQGRVEKQDLSGVERRALEGDFAQLQAQAAALGGQISQEGPENKATSERKAMRQLSGAEFLQAKNAGQEASPLGAVSQKMTPQGVDPLLAQEQAFRLGTGQAGQGLQTESLRGRPNRQQGGFNSDDLISLRPYDPQSGAGLGAGVRAPFMPEVKGHVTLGSMARERLSSESVGNVATQVQGLSLRGGGEMKIRLHPDNLGELQVRVRARGNSVGLQIQASDERARRVIEGSIGFLKESLASQNLSLAKVDVTLAQPHAGDSGTQSQQQHHAQNHNPQQQQQQTMGGLDFFGQDSSSRGWTQSSDEGDERTNTTRTARPGIAAARPGWTGGSAARADGRLDVMA